MEALNGIRKMVLYHLNSEVEMNTIKIAVSIPVRGATCGFCPLISYAHDDDPVSCTAFQQEFGPENVDEKGYRLRLPQCIASQID